MRIKELIKWAADGMTLKEILEKLNISYEEYKKYLTSLSSKNKETLQRLLARNARNSTKKARKERDKDISYPSNSKKTNTESKTKGKIMEMAYFGETKQVILAKLDMDEKSYKYEIKKLSEENRRKLRRWLISNAKRRYKAGK